MIIKVNRDALEKLLKRGEAIADKKASMAILSMALLNFDQTNNTLYLTTTDLEQGFRGKISCLIEGESSSFCVPCRKFYEIIKIFPEEEVLLIKEDNRLLIKDEGERVIYEISITTDEDFPSLPDFYEENLLEIPGKVLSQLIEKTIFCASKEEARFVLGGVYIEPQSEENKLRAVASDGHRLALYETEVLNLENLSSKEGFILSRKGADIISEISEEELLVKFGFRNNYAVLFFSDGFFFSRTIEGTYPDYRAVIPQEFQNILKIDRKLFMDGIKRVSLLVSEKFKPIKLDLKEAEMILSSPETEVGKAQIKLSAEYEGSPLSITFNADYLLSALEHMNSEEIEMKIKDERAPAVITGYRDEGFLYLLMPMVI